MIRPWESGCCSSVPAARLRRNARASGLLREVAAARRVGDPARIDFTAPYGATGLFALDAQSELLRPFEGIALVGEEGVGSSNWSLEIPRITNPLLDYETIADVLLTIEYTARPWLMERKVVE